MLRDRLWMGALLILLVVGVLVFDQRLAPWYPILFLLILTLSLVASFELRRLFGPDRAPPAWLCLLSVFMMALANWIGHLPGVSAAYRNPWQWIVIAYALLALIGFLHAMATFKGDGQGRALTQLAFYLFLNTYLGIFSSFLAQLRWPPVVRADNANLQAVLGLAMTIFVPKFCDIGAYTVGRLFGKHKMAPVLSPGKTWQGFFGGLVFAMGISVGINSFGPVLPGGWWTALGFGLTIGIMGVLGDLAESMIKRECQQKDAGQVVPGFGGVLDVVDSILFTAPIAYLWLCWI